MTQPLSNQFKKALMLIALTWGISGIAIADELPSRYHTYNQVLDSFAVLRDSYHEFLKLDTMGYSQRDNVPMFYLKISDNAELDEDEPAVFLCSAVHSEEVLGSDVLLNYTGDLVRRYIEEDRSALWYIRNLEIYIIPFLNPEGRLVVEGGNLDWRKNKSDNDSNGVFNIHDGVDINRNYDIGWQWDTTLAGRSPESLMFKGYAPFSESENRAMAAFAYKYKPIAAIDYHSPTYGTGEVAYFPWNFVNGQGQCPDYAMISGICRAFCNHIRKENDSAYYSSTYGYVNKAELRTYLYGHYGTVALTVEVCTTNMPSSPARVDGIVGDQIQGLNYLLDRALGAAVTGVIRDSITLEPIEAEVKVVQRTNTDIQPRLSRADNGRFQRLLDNGTYSLQIIKTGYRTKTITNVVVANKRKTTVNVLLSPNNPRPPAPNLIYPEPRGTFETGIFTFDWSNPATFDRFRFEVGSDTGFTNLVIGDSLLTMSQYRPQTPLALGHYYWRVKAHNANGWGPFSSRRDFHITAWNDLASNPELPTEYYLYPNYPNPFNSTTIISFDLPRQSQIELVCYDITGALVNRLVSGVYPPGHHEIKWDGLDNRGKQVASGVYYYKLSAGKFSAYYRMILLK
jgi:hypothetical protein